MRISVVVPMLLFLVVAIALWLLWSEGNESRPQREDPATMRVRKIPPPPAPPPETREDSSAADELQTPSDPASHATITVLEVRTRRPAPDTQWRLTSLAGAPPVEFTVPDDGAVAVPQGSWRVSAASPPWHSLEPRIDVRGGDGTVLWVSLPRALTVQVVDATNQAVRGARVQWHPQRDSWAREFGVTEFWQKTPTAGVTTDGEGIAALSGLAIPFGTVTVLADGFLRADRTVDSACTADRITVSLSRATTAKEDLRFLDAVSGDPIGGGTLVADTGPVPGASRADGLLDLPTWVMTGEGFVAKAPDYTSVLFIPASLDDPDVVRLHPAATVRVRVVDALRAPVQGASVLPEILRNPAPMDGRLLPFDALLTDAEGRASFQAPLGAELAVRAVADDGRAAQASWSVTRRSDDVALALGADSSLALFVMNEGGAPLGNAYASVGFSGARRPSPSVHVAADSDGRILVPFPENVHTIRVDAPGYARLELRPSPGIDTPRDGTLRVPLAAAADVAVRIVSSSDRPLPGMRVTLRAQSDGENIRHYPKLFGSAPTAHPAWVSRHSALAVLGFSDGQGRFTARGVPAGMCTVEVDPPDATLNTPVFADPMVWSIAVPSADEAVLVFPDLRPVTFAGYDALTGQALRSMVVSETGSHGMVLEVNQNRWSGWVAGTWSTLEIGSPGYASETVDLSPSGAEPVVREVHLHPVAPSRIVIEGEAVPDLLGKTVSIHAFRESAWGERIFFWNAALTIDPDGQIQLNIPAVEDGVSLFIEPLRERDAEGRRWTFEPDIIPWSSGSEVAVTAVEGARGN